MLFLFCVGLVAAVVLIAYRLGVRAQASPGQTQVAAVTSIREALRPAEEPASPVAEQETDPPEADPQARSAWGEPLLERAGGSAQEFADNSDRRKYQRIATDQQITVTPFAAKGQLAHGRDVSLGGIRFEVVGCPAVAGDLVRISFNAGGDTVDAIGRVIRRAELDPITAELGVEFVRIDPWAARLLAREMGSEP